eukprot:TRINITY_DN893_c0_g1_i1.p1 TRINITY_DN893_c0_g1~~TRINITY_DN893_c0_g1_i1.p1  ORF type:complete len:568 (-),score=86.14 TRINITY_DN893_c0_g1_i1:118-1821(-)
MNSHVCKVQYGTDTRRLKLAQVSISELQERVKSVFQIDQVFLLLYMDEENDWVSVTSDFELEEAFVCFFGKLLKLFAFEKHSAPINTKYTSLFPSTLNSSIMSSFKNETSDSNTRPDENERANTRITKEQARKATALFNEIKKNLREMNFLTKEMALISEEEETNPSKNNEKSESNVLRLQKKMESLEKSSLHRLSANEILNETIDAQIREFELLKPMIPDDKPLGLPIDPLAEPMRAECSSSEKRSRILNRFKDLKGLMENISVQLAEEMSSWKEDDLNSQKIGGFVPPSQDLVEVLPKPTPAFNLPCKHQSERTVINHLSSVAPIASNGLGTGTGTTVGSSISFTSVPLQPVLSNAVAQGVISQPNPTISVLTPPSYSQHLLQKAQTITHKPSSLPFPPASHTPYYEFVYPRNSLLSSLGESSISPLPARRPRLNSTAEHRPFPAVVSELEGRRRSSSLSSHSSSQSLPLSVPPPYMHSQPLSIPTANTTLPPQLEPEFPQQSTNFSRYDKEMQQLREMGFGDDDINFTLLSNFHGNLYLAIASLLNSDDLTFVSHRSSNQFVHS